MATAFDIRNPQRVARELGDLGRTLDTAAEVPASMAQWLADLCQDLASTGTAELEGVSPDDWAALQAGALRAASALLHEHDVDSAVFRRQVRLAVEELRFRLARMAEAEPVNEAQPVKDVAIWLERNLDLSQVEKGALFGVSDRTWQRWSSPSESAEPSGAAAVQLRLLARLVNELRHVLTSTGVARWATQPLADLDGATPMDAFRSSDPEAVGRVFAISSAARSGAAA